MADDFSQQSWAVNPGKRFEFGKNWVRFLSDLTVPRIKLAEKSLQTMLQARSLEDKSFLDIGSGSGLFSLAARRLGARVHSFDCDPHSVACTQELRRRYFPDDPNWTVERGSVLDKQYLASLGSYDIVYSWGVLHHTGAMWQALENVKPLVPIGGQLFIAIYNDVGSVTDRWARVKRTYNLLPRPLALVFAIGVIAQQETRELLNYYRHGAIGEWLRAWTEYPEISTRGMSRWHDWIDWIGGYPYERTSAEVITDIYSRDGFKLTNMFDVGVGYGCNEFVFRRAGSAGEPVEIQFPNSREIGRRLGRRVHGPYELTEIGWIGLFHELPSLLPGTTLYLLRGDTIVGAARLLPGRRIVIAKADAPLDAIKETKFYIVAAQERRFAPPFFQVQGLMWARQLPDLAEISDTMSDEKRSSLFVFEDYRQLPQPHAAHADIARLGGGRFSHWGPVLYFSTTDGTNPNDQVHRYSVLIGMPPALVRESDETGLGRLGWRLAGPPERSDAGWLMRATDNKLLDRRTDVHLVRDARIIGPVTLDAAGRAVVAGLERDDEVTLQHSTFHVVVGRRHPVQRPFSHGRGFLWIAAVPNFKAISDGIGHDRCSPLVMLEDGFELPHGHAVHDEIAEMGGGNYSHWDESVFFSSTDWTDPNTNGRAYELFEPMAPAP